MPGHTQARRAAESRSSQKGTHGRDMKHQRIIVSTLSLLAGALLLAPAAASASGPLLSGYGPPGAGAQTILGASLVNGPGGGAGGSGSSGTAATANAASSAASGTISAGVESATASSRSASGNPTHARGARARTGSMSGAGRTSAANPRAAGANPNPSHLGGTSAVGVTESATSWFSGSDLLALLLASGALALVALATVRLTRASMIESTEDEAVGIGET